MNKKTDGEFSVDGGDCYRYDFEIFSGDESTCLAVMNHVEQAVKAIYSDNEQAMGRAQEQIVRICMSEANNKVLLRSLENVEQKKSRRDSIDDAGQTSENKSIWLKKKKQLDKIS